MLSFVIFLAVMLALIIFGIPIAYSIALGTLAMMVSAGMTDVPISIVAQKMYTGIDSFPLLAVPLYMLAGNLMERGGMSERLVKLLSIVFGKVSGGLSMVSIAGCMFFSGISGAATADVAAIGGVTLPMMKKKGYPMDYAAAAVATAGVTGPLIPPSIQMVIYSVTCGVSIGWLFVAGFVPGILVGIGLLVVAYFQAKKLGLQPDNIVYSKQEVWTAFKESFLTLLAPVFIIGAIVSGVFTATEAAAVAIVYSFILGKFVYKELSWNDIGELIVSAMVAASTVMLLVAASALTAWMVAYVQLPTAISVFFANLTSSPLVLLIILNVFLFFWGMIMDITPAIMLLGPILIPLLTRYGIGLDYFGIIMITNLSIGLVTPPVGTVLYVVSNIAGEKPLKVAKAAIPFILIMLAVLLLMVLFPDIVYFVPNLFF